MSKTAHIIFICSFLLIIYSVGIVQGITETARDEGIQILDVIEDTFITPVKRSQKIAELFDQLSDKLDRVTRDISRSQSVPQGEDLPDLESAAQDMVFTLQDIRNSAMTVNRHISTDTLGPFFKELGTLHSKALKLNEMILDSREPPVLKDEVTRLQISLKGLQDKNKRPGIITSAGLVLKNFFNYTGFSQEYLRKYESDTEENSVFANFLRPLMLVARYLTLGDLGEKGIPGNDGWYFYRPGHEYLVRPYIRDARSVVVDPNYQPLTDDPIAAIVKFKKQLDARGIELLVVIVPGKESIYPDMLDTRTSSGESGRLTHSLRTLAELNELGVETVDLFTPFAEARKIDGKVNSHLYMKTDTHWKARGLRLAARIVADRVKQYPWYESGSTEYVVEPVEVDRKGDIVVMTTLPDFELGGFKLNFSDEKTTCHQVKEVFRDDEGTETSRRLYKDDFRNSRILLIGDSFSRIFQTDAPRSAGFISHIATQLSQPIASIVSDGGASTLVRQKLSRKKKVLKGKKLVIWEFVERDLRFGAEGWKDVEL